MVVQWAHTAKVRYACIGGRQILGGSQACTVYVAQVVLMSNLKHMVINILVDVESIKCIKCVRERKGPWNTSWAEYWKVCSSNNGIEMDNSEGLILVWFDFPHAHELIWILDNGARVFDALMRKWKKSCVWATSRPPMPSMDELVLMKMVS